MFEGSHLTQEESEVLQMTYLLRHRLPDIALEDLVKLIDCHLPYPVHGSKYKLLKKFPTPKPIKIYYCYECEELSFKTSKVKEKSVCPKCGGIYTKQILNDKNQYYLHLPLKNQ